MWIWNRNGTAPVDWECRHGYPSQACGVIQYPQVPDMCAWVGQEMLRWYNSLPQQSHVRLGKIEMMREGRVGTEREDFQPNLHKLAGF